MTEITVQYERKFSDGNYGSEGLSVSLTIENNGEVEPFVDAESLSHTLRRFVLGELSQSGAERVAWAATRELNSPAPQPKQEFDPDERPF